MADEMVQKPEEAVAQAQAALLQTLYIPAFAKIAAEVGITFDTQEDLEAALETTAMLKLANVQAKAQGIDPCPSAKKAARDMLKHAMFEAQPTPKADKTTKDALATLLALGE